MSPWVASKDGKRNIQCLITTTATAEATAAAATTAVSVFSNNSISSNSNRSSSNNSGSRRSNNNSSSSSVSIRTRASGCGRRVDALLPVWGTEQHVRPARTRRTPPPFPQELHLPCAHAQHMSRDRMWAGLGESAVVFEGMIMTMTMTVAG